MTTSLAELTEYLSPKGLSVEELERMLQEPSDLEFYGNLPLRNINVGQQYPNTFLFGAYDFLNGDSLKDALTEAIYIGRTGSNATIELNSPSRLLDIEHTFGLSLPQELIQQCQVQARYLPLSELCEQEEHLGVDPGEYLTMTIPAENLSSFLHNSQFLIFLQQFQNHVNQRMQDKIKETAEKIEQLLRLERGDSLELDYLDVTNLPRDFITTYQPIVLQEKGKAHYLYRKDGSIRQTLETNFNEAEGKVSLTRIGMNPEEKVELRSALGEGQLFYFRDVGIILMRKYLERQVKLKVRKPFAH